MDEPKTAPENEEPQNYIVRDGGPILGIRYDDGQEVLFDQTVRDALSSGREVLVVRVLAGREA